MPLTAGINMPRHLMAKSPGDRREIRKTDRIPQKGEEFNESFVFPDESTSRPIRRLTSNRMINQKATYPINTHFLIEHLLLSTYNEERGVSALIRANARMF